LFKHEKKAFIKFFSIYFGSVAVLILLSGHFYYTEQKQEFLKDENFEMLDYARMYKTKTPKQNTDITHVIKKMDIPNFNISNFTIKEDHFIKYIPHNWLDKYMIIQKPKKMFNKKIYNLQRKIILSQVLLLFIFASISYFLSKMALRPIREAVVKLDNFSKDLIHDINTPITSILLNMKLLKKDENFASNKYLNRISKNIKDIHSLNSNLTILLKENSLDIQNIDIFEIINESVDTYKKQYPNINIEVSSDEYFANINKDAFKQIISNLLSNASKYSKEKDAYIEVFMKNNTLHVADNGLGIKNPSYIFERNYKEHESGHGIGLDIAKRLCDAMNIKISVSSKENEGSEFSLKFL